MPMSLAYGVVSTAQDSRSGTRLCGDFHINGGRPAISIVYDRDVLERRMDLEGYKNIGTIHIEIDRIATVWQQYSPGTRPSIFHLYITSIVAGIEKLFGTASHVSLTRKKL